jgi:hypothetical protein
VMSEITLLSSHAPWTSIPHLVDWNTVGNGSVFNGMDANVDPGQVRTNYTKSVVYTLDTLITYLEKYADPNQVMIFLGDHQPAPVVTGENASRDVPIVIISKDQTVLNQISSWGWQDGLHPNPQAPTWPMNTFRDKFLTAFGPH